MLGLRIHGNAVTGQCRSEGWRAQVEAFLGLRSRLALTYTSKCFAISIVSWWSISINSYIGWSNDDIRALLRWWHVHGLRWMCVYGHFLFSSLWQVIGLWVQPMSWSIFSSFFGTHMVTFSILKLTYDDTVTYDFFNHSVPFLRSLHQIVTSYSLGAIVLQHQFHTCHKLTSYMTCKLDR